MWSQEALLPVSGAAWGLMATGRLMCLLVQSNNGLSLGRVNPLGRPHNLEEIKIKEKGWKRLLPPFSLKPTQNHLNGSTYASLPHRPAQKGRPLSSRTMVYSCVVKSSNPPTSNSPSSSKPYSFNSWPMSVVNPNSWA